MMDRLNILLSLDVSTSQIKAKYIQRILLKMNDKFEKNPLPVTLIFDNLETKNISFSEILDVLKKMKEQLARIKMIIIERD
jgi:hypothetical protein